MTIQPPTVALAGGMELEEVGGQAEAPYPAPASADAPSDRSPGALDPTDERLLALFLKGDSAALGTLAQRHERQLLGLALGLLGGRRDLALDAVQDTWLRVIKYGRSFRSGSTVKTWLYRILVNACKDTRTRSFKLAGGGTGSSLPVENLTVATNSSANGDTPTQSHIRAAIESLPGDHRLLILLCYHNGLTHPQAAEVLNIPVGTLKSRLHTALNTLRSHLQNPRGNAGATEAARTSPAPAPKERTP
jgi:RNA polymerase sigma-70 factor (ECF subfamily)